MLPIIIINPTFQSITAQICYHFLLAALQNLRLIFPSKTSYALDNIVLIPHSISKKKKGKKTYPKIAIFIYKADAHVIAV